MLKEMCSERRYLYRRRKLTGGSHMVNIETFTTLTENYRGGKKVTASLRDIKAIGGANLDELIFLHNGDKTVSYFIEEEESETGIVRKETPLTGEEIKPARLPDGRRLLRTIISSATSAIRVTAALNTCCPS